MTLWIRADGSQAIGLGHIMRTLAVAEAAAEQGVEVQYCISSDPFAAGLPSRRGFEVIEVETAQDTDWLRLISRHDQVIFDGYHFPVYQHTLARSRGARVAAIDDSGRGEFDVDVLINPDPFHTTDYRVPGAAKLCIGPKYAPVRREFVVARRDRSWIRREPHRLLLAHGGSNPAGWTERTLAILADRADFPELTVLVGPAAAKIAAGEGIEVLSDPPSVAHVISASDAAISSAGTTAYELLCIGVPAALMVVAENQKVVGEFLAAEGAALLVRTDGNFESDLIEAVRRLTRTEDLSAQVTRGQTIVDGLGAGRALAAVFGEGYVSGE